MIAQMLKEQHKYGLGTASKTKSQEKKQKKEKKMKKSIRSTQQRPAAIDQ